MGNPSRIGIGLERPRRLTQQHLTMGNPENLLFPVDGVFQQPQGSRISFSAAGGQHDQRAVRRLLVDLVHTPHSLGLVRIQRPGIGSPLGKHTAIGPDFCKISAIVHAYHL